MKPLNLLPLAAMVGRPNANVLRQTASLTPAIKQVILARKKSK